MQYWEIIADKLHASGWSLTPVPKRIGLKSHIRLRWIVDAHCEGRRYIVQSDELLSAFLEAETDAAVVRRQQTLWNLQSYLINCGNLA